MNRRHLITALAATPFLTLSAQAANVPTPRNGEALVVFYRPRRATGAAIRFNISGSAGNVGTVANGSLLAHAVKPGQHRYQVSTPSVDGTDSISVNLKAGQTAFVRCDMRLGWPAGRGKFTAMSDAQGRAEIAAL